MTLSLGERSEESYRVMRKAGADRYLLREETSIPEHYAMLHPEQMSLTNRLHCLEILKRPVIRPDVDLWWVHRALNQNIWHGNCVISKN